MIRTDRFVFRMRQNMLIVAAEFMILLKFY